MKLGKNQIIALTYLNKEGTHAPTGAGRKPWQFSTSQYRRILDSLVARGLVAQLESGRLTLELRVGAVQRFTPNYAISPAGAAALANLKGNS
jgi:DNA-binding IclR family transcriptional regulator